MRNKSRLRYLGVLSSLFIIVPSYRVFLIFPHKPGRYKTSYMEVENPLFQGYFNFLPALLHHIYTISATIAISSLSVSSSTWQYKSIVICRELCPNIFCNVFGRIPFAMQFVANVCLKQCGVNRAKQFARFSSLMRSIKYKIAVLKLLSCKG